MRFERLKKEPAFNLEGTPGSGGPASPAAARGRGRPPKTPTKPNGKDDPEVLDSGAPSEDDGDDAEYKDIKHQKPPIKKVQKGRVTKNTTPVKKSKISQKASMATSASAAPLPSDADDSDLPVTPFAKGVTIKDEEQSVFGGMRTGSNNGSYVIHGGDEDEDDDAAIAQLVHGGANGDSDENVDALMEDDMYTDTHEHWKQQMKDEI